MKVPKRKLRPMAVEGTSGNRSKAPQKNGHGPGVSLKKKTTQTDPGEDRSPSKRLHFKASETLGESTSVP